MRLIPIVMFVVATSSICADLAAQGNPPVTPGKIGFTVNGVQGSAGLLCSGFQCTALPLGLTRGETLTLAIRTQLRSPWFLLIGPTALPACLTIPGIGNTWAGPNVVVAAGLVTQQDRIRCWGGLQSIPVNVPATIPLQISAVFQVVADVQLSISSSAKGPVFSAPVELTVTR